MLYLTWLLSFIMSLFILMSKNYSNERVYMLDHFLKFKIENIITIVGAIYVFLGMKKIVNIQRMIQKI